MAPWVLVVLALHGVIMLDMPDRLNCEMALQASKDRGAPGHMDGVCLTREKRHETDSVGDDR